MKKVLKTVFLVFISLALIMAVLYVLVQSVAVITANGALTVWAEDNLEGLVCTLCSVSAIVAFLMSYVFQWKTGD